MRFDLTDLRLFLNVCDAGSITGGAQATHMTLASASERVRGMEDAIGVPLLLREHRGVQPTPAGRTLMHHARLVLQQMDRLHGELGSFGNGLRGHVRLLCNTSALSEHLPDVLSTFLREHPGISMDLEERPSDDIVDAVRHNVCDIGVVSDAADTDGLETFAFRPDALVLVVPAGHPLAQRTAVSLADLAQQSFVGLVDGSALQAHIAQHARRLGQRLEYRIRLRTLDAVCRMVGLGVGVGIVPKTVALRCARSCKIRRVRLTDAWSDRRLVVCVRKLADLPAPAQQMVRHVLCAPEPGRAR